MMPINMFRGPEYLPKWSDSIQKILKRIAAKQLQVEDIVNNIREFKIISDDFPLNHRNHYDHRKDSSSYAALLNFYGPQIPKIFSAIANRVLNPPQSHIPFFEAGVTQQHTFQKQEIVYLLCLMALCLISPQNYSKRQRYGRTLDFSHIFSQEELKTKTVIEYLKLELLNPPSKACMTVRRESFQGTLNDLIKASGQLKMSRVKIEDDKQDIEKCYGQLKVDFANKFIGGGVLRSGCVQEQLMFANRPQLLATLPLCEVMGPNQALYFHGFRKYFRNTGYGQSSKFAGFDDVPYEVKEGHANDFIIAIDAINFKRKPFTEQINPSQINRQIVQAYCGFKISENTTIATGNWGCGVFRGDIKVKFLIQWIAASLTQKQLRYYPFGSRDKVDHEQLLFRLEKMTVKEVFYLLHAAAASLIHKNSKTSNIYDELKANF